MKSKMKKLFFILFLFGLFLSINPIFGAEIKQIDSKYLTNIVNAIQKAENSKRFPYGIVSIKIKGDTQAEREAFCRKICFNTVRNNYIRWQKAGCKEDYITFLGNRYCPIGASNDPKGLNKNWIKNVNKFLANG